MITIDSNIKKSIEFLEKVIEFNDASVTSKDLHEVGLTMRDKIRSNIQSEAHVISGDLHASVDIYDETPTSVLVGSDKEYAPILEYGRGPVEAKPGKVLHFTTRDGEEVFTKRVGPTDPTGVFERGAISGAIEAIDRIVEEKRRKLEAAK